MDIGINKQQSVIYIICLSNVKTGGIELLHQLYYKLDLLGYPVRMVYQTPEDVTFGVPDEYEKYHVKKDSVVVDQPENVIIIPEIFLPFVQEVHYAKKILWWLSVDNAKGTCEDFDRMWKDKGLLHFVQSQYAMQYVKEHGVLEEHIYWLSDYINSEFLHMKKIPLTEKENLVLFNPLKGFQKTSEIIRASQGDMKWQALSGFSAGQMRDILQHAKVYIDFGNHPGKDRIPREAVMCGCCLLTNKKGAAANTIDIPIHEHYKYDSDTEPAKIVEDIQYIMEHYEEEYVKYSSYRNRTRNEFRTFENDIAAIFEKICYPVCDRERTWDEIKEHIVECLSAGDYKCAYLDLMSMQNMELPWQEDVVSLLLEANIRNGLGEYNEAEFAAKQALELQPDNYEVILLLAAIHLQMGAFEELMECKDECVKAITYSVGTEDEDEVRQAAIYYMQQVKRVLEEHVD